jgi:hypothetical protein
MLGVLPSGKNPDIDKFAILLRPNSENPEPWTNAKGRPKMIGLVGTNRISDQGLETGYFLNKRYWGKGYATGNQSLSRISPLGWISRTCFAFQALLSQTKQY